MHIKAFVLSKGRIKKLLQLVVLPENVKFYDSIVTKEDNIIISKSKIRAQQMLCENCRNKE
jgi:hypothetical protein